jgi:iron(III) transport system substrate-binding protein
MGVEPAPESRRREDLLISSSSPRRAIVLLAAVLALAVAAGAATNEAKSAKKAGPLAGLIKQSKQESGLVFYGNPPTSNFQALVDRFHYYYPWIKVTSYDLDDNVVFSKYASEAGQGVRTADVLIASAPNLWVYANRKGYALNFTPQDIAKYPAFARQYKGIYVMSPDPAIIVYNKLLLKDKVPNSIAEIASDSSTYGKLTGYSADNTFGYTGLYGYVQKKGWSNLETIGKRLKPASGVSSQLQLVAQGGAVAAYLTSPTARFTIKSNSQYQQLLDWTYAKDATPLVTRGIAITKKAASPASAKLFLDFVYSKAGQLAMCDAGFTAFRTGYVPPNGCTNTLADVYKKVGQKNVFVAGFTQKFVNDRPAFTKRWHGIFG